MSKLRTAVVGAGFFGRYHAQHYAAIPGSELVAVADRSRAAAERVAAEVGCPALADHRELLGAVDAVSVATPTAAHFAVAADFLEAGVAVLVEKPIAATVDEARLLVRLARVNDAVLQIGHVERFNPVWQAFAERPFRPIFVSARRASPFPFRSLDVSVVADVMIHDIDLAFAAAGSPLVAVEAVGGRTAGGSIDRADALLTFANGCQAHLSASRTHHRTERVMHLWNDQVALDLDFFARTAVRYDRRAETPLTLAQPATPEDRERRLEEMFACETRQFDKTLQPLRLELEDFLDAARNRRPPQVAGEAGLEALSAAMQIERAIDAAPALRRAA
jgi:predicted dehydrogenase